MNENISRGKLIGLVASSKKCKAPATQCKIVIDQFLCGIHDELKKGNKVQLLGFGSFKTVERKARMGINPQTGKKLKIPAKKTIKFTPAKDFKDAVN